MMAQNGTWIAVTEAQKLISALLDLGVHLRCKQDPICLLSLRHMEMRKGIWLFNSKTRFPST